MRSLQRTFLRGLATIAPIVVTLWALWWLGTTAERILGNALRSVLPHGTYPPGTGLIVGVALIWVIGLVMSNWLLREMVRFGERQIERVPVVKTVYGAVKDMMAFVGGDGQSEIGRPVLVDTGTEDAQLVGFVTRENASELTRRPEDHDKVAVFLPMSYQLGGFLAVLPRSRVAPIDVDGGETLRLVLTAGIGRKDDDR